MFPQSAVGYPQSGIVPRVGLKSELHIGNVFFCVLVEKLRESRRATDEDDHQSRRERIERSRVTDSLRTESTTNPRNDIMRCDPRGFIDDQNSIHLSILLRFDS